MKSWEEINREYEQELEQLRKIHAAFEKTEEAGEPAAEPQAAEAAAPDTKETEPSDQDVTGEKKWWNKKNKKSANSRATSDGVRISAVISNLIFYGAIALLFFAVLVVTSGDNTNGSVLGYRYYHVLTGSMNTVYPKGSIVIVKEKGDYEIQIGDDITFYTDPNTSVTHRVVDIIEDYDDDGARGYQTQGTENLNPDPDINHEENVVGKVVYCIPKLGSILELAKEHMVFIFILFIAAVVISLLIRMIAARRRQEKELSDSEKEWTIIPRQQEER